MAADEQARVVRDDDRGVFEVRVDGGTVGVAQYEREGPDLRFTHTVVQSQSGHSGLGTLLVTRALEAAREDGAGVLPQCSFVRAHLLRHPEQLDLVPADCRGEFGLPSA